MEEEIKSKTKEFAKAILECEEYRAFIENAEKLNKNAEAQKLLKEFQENQIVLRWNGFNPALMDELRELQTKINQNKTIQDFSKSQDELISLLKRTNTVISMRIGMQFGFSSGGGCCG
jgi:cell fate (sporulation/competence/biofilm development) regulator YlbF (YheA/YmcA/DUF963 family)